MFYSSLSEESVQQIQNIANNLKQHPWYTKYDVCTYCYDFHSGAYAIKISDMGKPINLFLFYPDFSNSGKIGSIAIYGSGLRSHLSAILSTKKIFGFDVESAEIDRSGMSDFIDVYLK